MVQQNCLWPTFYQTDFMKRYVNKSRLDEEFVNKITLEIVIDQQMKEEEHDQNY